MLTIIIPTLGERKQEFHRLLTSLETQTMPALELVVVSQSHHEAVSEWLKPISIPYTHIRLEEKGLSKARNAALPYVNGDLVTFSDDDCWYPTHAVATVHNRLKNGEDGCCFQIFDPEVNKTYKHYPPRPSSTVKGRMLFRKSSIELFFKTKALTSLRFHESFGLGSTYPSGEENLFLQQFTSLKKRLAYYPETIVFHQKPTKQSRLSEKQLISKGPLFKAMYNTPIGLLFLTALFIKKASSIEQPIYSYTKAIKALLSFNKQRARGTK
ncbi:MULTISPECIES: glycosyltransferase family 2 protein [Bacillaceae]|uniref:Glycosyltransferase 2-like domain-containing protein n=1 Tax=Alkalicoccobacillus plakortidis TaxID=444060 RepID=A0A9D5DV26_9BACI|nr:MULTISPECIES: glycosyltransferase family 2 protein [Bacillaceae]KQL57357.1 hypothetical protein AN965_07560 [Alkalicoccobacillus plakortidis]